MKFSKFFSNLQEKSWYRKFLNPVLEEIENGSDLLDIGTGAGKMLEILSHEKNVKCVGTDTSADMLEEAKEKLKTHSVKLHLTPAGEPLPFEKNSFNYITICSVLFHLKNEEIDKLLEDSLQLLKEHGKIIVLTPTGNENVFKLTKHYFSTKNLGIYIWYNATKRKAKLWTNNKYLQKYAIKNKLTYESQIVMKGFAQMEIINKN